MFPSCADCWGISSKSRPNCWLPIIPSRNRPRFHEIPVDAGVRAGQDPEVLLTLLLKVSQFMAGERKFKFRPHGILGLSTAIHLGQYEICAICLKSLLGK